CHSAHTDNYVRDLDSKTARVRKSFKMGSLCFVSVNEDQLLVPEASINTAKQRHTIPRCCQFHSRRNSGTVGNFEDQELTNVPEFCSYQSDEPSEEEYLTETTSLDPASAVCE